MALQELNNGKNYLVYIDPVTAITAETPPVAGAVTWKMLMCLSSNAFNMTVNGIDTTSKCTDGWADSIPGDGSWSITAEGQTVAIETDDLATLQSAEELFALAQNKTSFWAAIFDVAKNTYRVGVVFISSFSETFNNNAAYTFSITLTGRGKVYNAPTA